MTRQLTFSGSSTFIGSESAEGINRRASLRMIAQNATFITPFGDPSIYEQMNDGSDDQDGQNQYNYNFDTPGVLELNLKVKIEPASYASNIVEQCLFTVDDIGCSVKQWAAANPGGKPTVVNDCLIATVIFTGLPEHNDDFGWKTATLKYNGQNIAETKYGVFFPNLDANHPDCDTCSDCPNWFYYWREGGVCGIPKTNCVYDATLPYGGYTLPWQDSIIRLCYGAVEHAEPETHVSIIPDYGSITVKRGGIGIYRVARVIQHEQRHLVIYALFKHLRNLNNGWDAAGNPIQMLNFADDWDDDTMPNDVEVDFMGVATSPNDPDTYGTGRNFGDLEIRCMLLEDSLTIPVYREKDWAYPGCQHILYIKQGMENYEN
jgi:hypothetical protein